MGQETWTIKRCLDWTRDYLGSKGDARPRLSAEWLLTSATGLNRTQLYMNHDKPLSDDELSIMHKAVVRRAKGEPLQYIAGETSFRMIDVGCAEGVLIPRPETELLVEEVLRFIDADVLADSRGTSVRARAELPWNSEVEAARKAEEDARAEREQEESPVAEASDDGDASGAQGASDDTNGGGLDALAPSDGAACDVPRSARVLEVGCGTGCISLSLASERPGRVTCVATDIEPRAVKLATANRDRLGIDASVADFRLGDLVAPVLPEERGMFDVLVSNPPYIPDAVMRTLPHEVAAFEPALALAGGVDGLDVFRRLVKAAPSMLRPGGLLACELHEECLDDAAALCREVGMVDVRVVEDLAHRTRFILAQVR